MTRLDHFDVHLAENLTEAQRKDVEWLLERLAAAEQALAEWKSRKFICGECGKIGSYTYGPDVSGDA